MPPETVTDVFSGTAVQAAEDGCGPGIRSAGLCREPWTRQETKCSLVSGRGGSETASPPSLLPARNPSSLPAPPPPSQACRTRCTLSTDKEMDAHEIWVFFIIIVIMANTHVCCVYVCVEVTQLCPTLCDPTDCSPPGSSVHGILQARILEWVATPFSRGSSRPRGATWVSCIVGGFFII